MVNLLPPREKEYLLLERREKLITVLGYVVLVFLVFLLLVLFSVKFYLLAQEAYQSEILADLESKYQTPDFLFFQDIIQKYNTSLAIADNFYKNEVRISDALKVISELERPKGLYLTNIAIEKSAQEEKMMATVSGVSNTRDSLIYFKDSVDKNENVKSIYFPANNWIKPIDFAFYLTFEIVPIKKLTNSLTNENEK